jgi:peroxiredoxin
MTAYRDRYAKIQAKGAQIVAISTDDVETLKKFKESLGAPFPFLSDPEGKVAAQFGGASEGYANRATFVIAPDGTIGHTETGMAALVPDPAIDACPQGGQPTRI